MYSFEAPSGKTVELSYPMEEAPEVDEVVDVAGIKLTRLSRESQKQEISPDIYDDTHSGRYQPLAACSLSASAVEHHSVAAQLGEQWAG